MSPLRRLSRRFLTFAACGAVGTLCHYLVMIALVHALRVGPVAASVAGFLAGMGFNYALNYRLTFRSRKRHRETAAKYLVVAGCGLALNAALMQLLTGPVALHYLVAQVGATGVVLLWNFTANHTWTFAPERGPR